MSQLRLPMHLLQLRVQFTAVAAKSGPEAAAAVDIAASAASCESRFSLSAVIGAPSVVVAMKVRVQLLLPLLLQLVFSSCFF